MNNDDIKITIIELYEKNQQRLSGNLKYEFKLTDKRNDVLDKFIDNITKHVDVVGVELLKGYISYAFGTYAGRGVNSNPSAFYITWIISFTLFKKYLSAKSGRKWGRRKNLKRERSKIIKHGKKRVEVDFETSLEKKEKNQARKKMFNDLDDFEEVEKKRFHNTRRGRLWCVDFTTLYNERSKYCETCDFKNGCIESLKNDLPNLYKLRNG